MFINIMKGANDKNISKTVLSFPKHALNETNVNVNYINIWCEFFQLY